MRGPQRGAGVALVGVQARDLLLSLPFRVPHPSFLRVGPFLFQGHGILRPLLSHVLVFAAQGALARSARGPAAFSFFVGRGSSAATTSFLLPRGFSP